MEATTLCTQACKGYMGSNFLQHMRTQSFVKPVTVSYCDFHKEQMLIKFCTRNFNFRVVLI
jgi:hypothetical protein